MKIAIISSSVREGRLSHRVALFLKNYIAKQTGMETEVLDLKEYNFPLFHERLFNLKDPSKQILDYSRRFTEADGIVVVSPVYNGSFPASLKNVIDLLYKEWRHKPVCVVSVTYGNTPGISTVQALQVILLKMEAHVVPPLYTVLRAAEEYSETGVPTNIAAAEKMAKLAIDELVWMMEKSNK